MPKLYGGGGSGPVRSSFAPFTPSVGSGFSQQASTPQDFGVGKTDINLLNIAGSVAGAAGSLAQFGGGLVGGVTGAVGGIGLGDGKNIGALGDVPGNVLGAVGGVELPNLGPNPGHAHLGDVPGVIGYALGAPERALERTVAGFRVQGAKGDKTSEVIAQAAGAALNTIPGGLGYSRPEDVATLPPDLQAQLDGGASVSDVADALVARNAGFTNNPLANTAGSIVYDPTNLLSLGAGKAVTLGKEAGIALNAAQEGDKLGIGQRVIGSAYNAATKGMSAGGATVVDRLLGPTTSGVFRSLGVGTYTKLSGRIARLSPDYSVALDDALGVAQGNLLRGVVADNIGSDVRAGLTALPTDVRDFVNRSVSGYTKVVPRAKVEKVVGEMLDRVRPDLAGITDRTGWAADRLATITGMTPEDAARAIGPNPSDKTLQMLHLAYYGHAGDELVAAKSAAEGIASNLGRPVADITMLAPDTLTKGRAEEVLRIIDSGDQQALDDAVNRYEILARKFHGQALEPSKVRQYIHNVEEILPQEIKAPRSGRNPLPPSLGEWRAKYAASGYDLGFAPKDMVKTIRTPDGAQILTNPFAEFTSAKAPLTYRNPMGRMVDGLLGGITQTKIINSAEARFKTEAAKAGLDPSRAGSIFYDVMDEARNKGISPRGLTLSGNYDDIFRRTLGEEGLAQLKTKADPTYLVMKAFEGNLADVGLTQKLTGLAKTKATAGNRNIVAAIAEGIYPTFRFRLSPLFQTQELIESPLWNALRGVSPFAKATPEEVNTYHAIADSLRLNYMFEGYAGVMLAGSDATRSAMASNTLLGKALSRFPNVAKFKQDQMLLQTFSENGQRFVDFLSQASPRALQAMREAYGTNDARVIAQKFLEERLALAGHTNSVEGAMSVIDGAKPLDLGPDAETVWQGFRHAFQESSKAAFKTHYFSPERGWLERTINHPYLGLYPASYYWGKVVPEFARFLLARPFGLKAPLAGLEATQRVQQAMIAAQATDPGFQQWMADNKDMVYAWQLLLPGTPDNIPVNAPAYARHAAQRSLAGKPFQPTQTVTSDLQDAFSNIGPARDVGVAVKSGADLFDILSGVSGDLFQQLDAAAKVYDTNVTR